MNPLDKLKMHAAQANSSRSRGRQIVLPVQILGYDLRANPARAIGHPLLPGGEPDRARMVAVSLRERTKQTSGTRLEIANLAEPGSKSHVALGGIVAFSYTWDDPNAYVAANGASIPSYSAGWANVIAHVPGEAAAKIVYGSMYVNVQKRKVALGYLQPDQTVACRSIQEVEAALAQGLQPEAPDQHRQAHVRIHAADGDMIVLKAQSQWSRRQDSDWKQVADGATSARQFIEERHREGLWPALDESLRDGQVRLVEVIPGAWENAVGATRDNTLKNQHLLDRIAQDYRDPQGAPAFRHMVIALRQRQNGSRFLTFFMAQDSSETPGPLEQTPTPYYDGRLLEDVQQAMSPDPAPAHSGGEPAPAVPDPTGAFMPPAPPQSQPAPAPAAPGFGQGSVPPQEPAGQFGAPQAPAASDPTGAFMPPAPPQSQPAPAPGFGQGSVPPQEPAGQFGVAQGHGMPQTEATQPAMPAQGPADPSQGVLPPLADGPQTPAPQADPSPATSAPSAPAFGSSPSPEAPSPEAPSPEAPSPEAPSPEDQQANPFTAAPAFDPASSQPEPVSPETASETSASPQEDAADPGPDPDAVAPASEEEDAFTLSPEDLAELNNMAPNM